MARKEISPKKRKLNKTTSSNIKAIYKAGVRRNTQKAVSPKNKRRPVTQKQAVAIAISMAKNKDKPLKTIPNKRFNKWHSPNKKPKRS